MERETYHSLRLAGVTARIEKVRHARGMSKLAFAKAFGMSRQTYQGYTPPLGRKIVFPSCLLLIGVCEAHNASAEWLLFGRGTMFNEKMVSK